MATVLKNGSRGEAVKQLQTQLNSAGYNLAVDGIYGAKTLAAVKDYQSKNNLTADGIAERWAPLAGRRPEIPETAMPEAAGRAAMR